MPKTTRNRMFPAIHKLVAQDDIRPQLGLAWVVDGYLIGTDCHAIFKINLKHWLGDDSELLEGKVFHRDHLKHLNDTGIYAIIVSVGCIEIIYNKKGTIKIPFAGHTEDGHIVVTNKYVRESVFRVKDPDEIIRNKIVDVKRYMDVYFGEDGARGTTGIPFKSLEKIMACIDRDDSTRDEGVEIETSGGTNSYKQIMRIISGTDYFYMMPVVPKKYMGK